MRDVLVNTDDAVNYCIHIEMSNHSREHIRRSLYHWARVGKIKNYGGSANNQARWSLFEVRDAYRGC